MGHNGNGQDGHKFYDVTTPMNEEFIHLACRRGPLPLSEQSTYLVSQHEQE